MSEEEKKEEMFGALHTSLISSDESETEGDPLVTRPLTWRTEDVSEYFKTLDERWKSAMTPQQKRQSVGRRLGLPSSKFSLGCTVCVNCNNCSLMLLLGTIRFDYEFNEYQ